MLERLVTWTFLTLNSLRQHPLSTTMSCCDLLHQSSSVEVLLPHTTEYAASSNSYWSKTAILAPGCIAAPKNTKEVATVLSTISKQECPFNVRGGGHSPHSGAANTDGGVLISLDRLKDIIWTDDSVKVGPGNRWMEVYQQAEPRQKVVVGGRLPTVGVPGLLLGGGISYFSYERGWAMDNVKSFEVVLANGTVVHANASSNKSLFRALKGGSSNFGIVTSFDLYTYPQGPVFAGSHFMDHKHHDTFIEKAALYGSKLVNHAPNTHVIPAFFKVPGNPLGDTFASFHLLHNDGLSYQQKIPEVFEPLVQIPAIEHDTRVQNMSTVLADLVSEPGHRQGWRAVTFKLNSELMKEIHEIWDEPITPNMIAQGEARGGNVLGLKTSDGPLILADILTQWEYSSEDDKMEQALDEIFERAVEAAKARGLYNPYLYLDYAPTKQPVIASYGEENVKFLRDVKAEYDPEDVFGRAGGHKLPV